MNGSHTRAEGDSANSTFGLCHNSFKRIRVWIALPRINISRFSLCTGECAVKGLVKSSCILVKVSSAHIYGLYRACTHRARVTVVFTATYETSIQCPAYVLRLLHAI